MMPENFPEPALCDLVRVIEIYMDFDHNRIRLGVEETQIKLGNDVSTEYAAMVYGQSMGAPMHYWREILNFGRRLTDSELALLERPAAHD